MSAPSNASPHTDNGVFFAAFRKHHRRECKNACSACLVNEQALGRAMRRCAKCQVSFYCSKECQTRDWPVHKEICGDGGIPKRMRKLAKALMSCPHIVLQLQSVFILAFDLLQRPRCDEPLWARVDIAVEPSSMNDLMNIFLRKEPPKDRVQGMVQINRFIPGTAADVTSPERIAAWRRQRAQVDSEGYKADALGMVEMCQTDSEFVVAFPLRIPSRMKQIVEAWRDSGCTITLDSGEETSVPYTVENCLQTINMQIRDETRNQLLLRTKMLPSDIQIIRDAATDPQTQTISALIFHTKLAREFVYKSIYPILVQRVRAVSIPPPRINGGR
ncbi:MYND-type domain-containing protein [Mycena sanguinolenta]|uniref:MYND-type domain-containing protein n=1 Tax=Mycena sanguinolenta TaxID=230812 RepID=A0A8H7CR57_9AGAR|nr:MYND-type domain-containing protein [Mycena sanguinolenta]